MAVSVLLTGCETTKSHSTLPPPNSMINSNDVVLREADRLRIVFPGAEQLNTDATIRRDGKITLPVIGELTAAGKTPAQLKDELAERYSKELVSSKDISVFVVSASFPVYVNGAVMKPGKVTTDHPITVLEAIMESGGPDYNRANLKSVKVVRTQNGKTETFRVNLKGLSNGTPIDIFYLQPSDIVYVPARITWF